MTTLGNSEHFITKLILEFLPFGTKRMDNRLWFYQRTDLLKKQTERLRPTLKKLKELESNILHKKINRQ